MPAIRSLRILLGFLAAALALYLGANAYVEVLAQGSLQRAAAQLPLVRLNAAIEALHTARRLTPLNPAVHNEIGRVEVMRWRWQNDASAELRAVNAYERAIELDPLSAVHYSDYAWALIRLGKPVDALIPLQAALARDPHNAYYLASLGRAHERAGNLEAALAAFEASRAVRDTRLVRDEITTLTTALAAQETPNATGSP